MVYREKNFAAPPPGLVDAKWDALKAEMLVEQQAHQSNSACYRDTTINWLQQIYKNKCAYCERNRGIELEVDHYRPKKPRNNKKDPEYNQPGYYWLSYTWSNLIPLCSRCNLLKSNKFPLEGWTETNRVRSHVNIANPSLPYDINWLQREEKPLLLHPEIEKEPARHFRFLKNGSIQGRTAKGSATIAICELNRKDLRRERIELRDDYVTALNKAFDAFREDKNGAKFSGALEAIFRSIKKRIHRDKAHSLFHLYIYRYFDYFIVPFVPKSIQQKVKRYFEDFRGRK